MSTPEKNKGFRHTLASPFSREKRYLHHVNIPCYHNTTYAEHIVLRRAFEHWRNTLSTVFLRSNNHWEKKGGRKVKFILIEKVFLGGGVTMTKVGKCKLRTTTEEDSIGKKIIRLKKAAPLPSRSFWKKSASNSCVDKWEPLSFAEGIRKSTCTNSQKRELTVLFK